MRKLIENREEASTKIKNAIRLITEPVVQTLSPLGGNTIYEDSNGQLNLTNDGVTIARQVQSDDPVENAIIEIIKHGALKTNAQAGDGTTTTILLTSVLLEEGLKMLDNGTNGMLLKKDLDSLGKNIAGNLVTTRIKSSKDLKHIANISANNDSEIAMNVVEVVKTAGEDGMVLIENHNKEETVVEKDTGFIIEGGLLSPEYAQNQTASATFENAHIFVTDKRLYYEEEAESILRAAIEQGVTDLVIVAREFIGKSVNVFAANQINNEAINLMLISDSNATEANNDSLSDLAVYTGATLVTDKHGKLVNKMEKDYFHEVGKVYSNPQRTVITSLEPDNAESKKRVDYLKKAKDKNEDPVISRRLASMTTGMVTVLVGGNTPIEVQEKVFRYEDAINATRSAMKHGYLVGGGMALLGAFNPETVPSEYHNLAKKLCEASVRRIAKNCGEHENYILSNCKPFVGFGYNAKTNEFEDLEKAGVIDPFKVTEMAIKNAVSIAGAVLSANWFIVNEKDKENKDGK